MPFVNWHLDHQKLCEIGRLSKSYCNTLMLAKEKSGIQTNSTSNGNAFPIGQRMDAIIYTMIVAVFYAGIILIILLSNAHRFRRDLNGTKRNSRFKSKRKCCANSADTRAKLKKNKCKAKSVVVDSNYKMTVLDTSDKYNNSPNII